MPDIAMFVGALVAVYLVPGPDMVLVLQTSSTQGRAAAMAAAAGLALARASHVALAALGLAALLKTAPWVFEAVRAAGAAYLVWLGVKIGRTASLVPDAFPAGRTDRRRVYARAAWRGLLTSGSNPKALLFCSVLLPQFVHPERGSVASQFLWLGVIVVVLGLLFDAMLAVAGMGLGRWLRSHPIAQHIQRWTFAALLIGFGARLALSGRPQ
ncbi:LysE family translocator [Bordetella petrii]|uniref:LysE family translocator n=1 Tax=Bordetella petrii TaxID=94624 RepID=A0ABT7VYF9_9BORD|nr:LysE family translocator [Bordetella petrii]MDM9557943.1 LysE family translocator [Bordetella petrii]